MPSDRLEAAHRCVDYLYSTRDDGRWDALECLLDAWMREARPAEFHCLGERLVALASARRAATVIPLLGRLRQRAMVNCRLC